jgi:Tat protein translocase TatB subunit
MLGIGMQEILIILVVALIVIGPKRLPEMARTLGKGFAEFKKATDDFQETVRKDLEQDRHEEFVKKYPHLVPEEEEEKVREPEDEEETGSSALHDNSSSIPEPQPAYEPEEIEGGEETENKTRDV